MDFDFDVVVIGSGPGGYVAAIKCAQLGLKTAVVEKDKTVGGTCLNVGCIPSKSLLHSSKEYDLLNGKHLDEHGIKFSNLSFDLKVMMERKSSVVKGFNQGIQGLFKKNKVSLIQGLATFVDEHTVDVNGKKVTSANFIIATGSTPTELPFLPFDEKTIVSSTGALALKEVPKKLLVVGAGVIGVELASVYHRLGSEVHFIEFLDRLCPSLDKEVGKAFTKYLTAKGMSFDFSTKVTGGKSASSGVTLQTEDKEYQADVALIAIGRRPFTEGLGLEKIGIALDKRGFIPINGRFQTSKANIFAIGDVVDGPMLAHKASEEGVATAEIIAGKNPHIEYMTIPAVIYTDPEVAQVGLTEEMAKEMEIEIKKGKFPFKANSRAKCVSEEEGFVKLIAEKETGVIIGGHIFGNNAGELIEEIALAIEKRATAKDIQNTSHAHPTLSEAIKEAAMAIVSKPIHM